MAEPYLRAMRRLGLAEMAASEFDEYPMGLLGSDLTGTENRVGLPQIHLWTHRAAKGALPRADGL